MVLSSYLKDQYLNTYVGFVSWDLENRESNLYQDLFEGGFCVPKNLPIMTLHRSQPNKDKYIIMTQFQYGNGLDVLYDPIQQTSWPTIEIINKKLLATNLKTFEIVFTFADGSTQGFNLNEIFIYNFFIDSLRESWVYLIGILAIFGAFFLMKKSRGDLQNLNKKLGKIRKRETSSVCEMIKAKI